MKLIISKLFIIIFFTASSVADQKENHEISEEMQAVIESHTLIISRWAHSTLLINSIIEQNKKDIPLEQITSIDKRWVAGKENKLVKSLQENEIGKHLRIAVERSSMYVEALLCDNKGALVANFPKTTDYWQGDEDKFIQSFNNAKGSVYIGPLTFDESTSTHSVQISVPVFDSNNTIGVLIVGIKNIEEVSQR